MLFCTTISNYFQCFTKCSHGKYEKLQHSSFVTFAAINATLTNKQISSVSILKVELLNYILIFMLLIHTFIHTHLMRSLPIHTLFSLTLFLH